MPDGFTGNANQVIKFADGWVEGHRIFSSLQMRWAQAMEMAAGQEAQFIRNKIVEGLKTQAPGGKNFLPHSPLTIALRQAQGLKGTKILIASAAMFQSIVSQRIGGGAYFVGVKRRAYANGKDTADIAEIQEKGTKGSRPMTAKQRGWFFAMLKKAGIETRKGFHGPLGGTFGGAAIGIKIPARPFMAPVIDVLGEPNALKQRFWDRVAILLDGDLGK